MVTNVSKSLKNLPLLNVTIFDNLEIILLTLFKLALDFTWLLPNWLLVFLVVEIFSVWGFLKEFGVVELGQKYSELVHKSIEKLVNMIPRYQAK